MFQHVARYECHEHECLHQSSSVGVGVGESEESWQRREHRPRTPCANQREHDGIGDSTPHGCITVRFPPKWPGGSSHDWHPECQHGKSKDPTYGVGAGDAACGRHRNHEREGGGKTAEGIKCAKALAQKEGIFVGISGGATVAAALQVAQKAKPGDVLLAMLPDTGERYFSTPLFEGVNEGSDDEWLASLGEAALP